MAVIERRTGRGGNQTYRVKIRLKGYAPQSATFSRITAAKRWAQKTESGIREGRYFPVDESRRKTVAEAIDRYVVQVLPRKPKSLSQQKRQLKWWRDRYGHMLLCDFGPAVIGEARDILGSEGTCRGHLRSSSTVVRYLAVVSHMLSIAAKEWQWIDLNPMLRVAKPKEGRGRSRFLSDSETEALLAACQSVTNSAVYVIVVLALATGMRKGEILGLRWSDVDLVGGRAILWETKNGERRVVALTGRSLEVLRTWARVRRLDTSLVFPGRISHKSLEFRKHWLKAMRLANLSDFRFHDLRHTAASYLAMNGATAGEIAEVLGHKTLQMVKRYSHFSEGHTRRVVEALDARIFNPTRSELEIRR